ncbi:putative caskin-2-like [Scophthalmus maximus]|uniref:Putative caskin-2-like n=1 Tax=Scophthalmus maximus TaxID=52904 RepID=A0A2U9CL17_SCOMX|nr:putative caskin-2-like [Scophthalmus maximus]
MGKEQDLLVAVKSGDLLLAHKLLSKVKCNKTSEYAANRGSGIDQVQLSTTKHSPLQQ